MRLRGLAFMPTDVESMVGAHIPWFCERKEVRAHWQSVWQYVLLYHMTGKRYTAAWYDSTAVAVLADIYKFDACPVS